MYSNRFHLPIHIMRHARQRMAERCISDEELLQLIETGFACYKNPTHAWIACEFGHRCDNLICAAVTLEDELVIKTVMHHFQWED